MSGGESGSMARLPEDGAQGKCAGASRAANDRLTVVQLLQYCRLQRRVDALELRFFPHKPPQR